MSEADLQRARWRRVLGRESLDTTHRDDFALGGLASRLRTQSVRLLLLPADPEADVVRIDDDLWAWLKDSQVVKVNGRNVRLGIQEIPTAHAAVIIDSYGRDEPWTSYVAIHRSGAFEYGLGDRGAWERQDREGKLVRVFNLISVVARAWALLNFASSFRDKLSVAGPFQLTVALHRSGGAFLGNVAEGWAEPLTWDNELPACVDSHLLWHFELDRLPDVERARELAFAVGDRLEDAWGVRHRRYLALVGELAGHLDLRHLHQ